MKTALVTGAARGLGHAIALNLAQDHNVAITWRSTAPTGMLTDHPNIADFQIDLSNPNATAALPKRVIDQFGSLDIIVNNAGSILTDDAQNYDAQKIATNFNVNVNAPMGLVAAALPHLHPGAAIVNISSQNARLPAMVAHSYSASKAALDTWTKIAAKALGPKGIRVNAVAPGAVNTPEATRPDDITDMIINDSALRRMATPEDIAAAVRFLASGAAGAITGAILDVNAGYRL
ncbi:SDR family oxidoreductase [Tateyamaria sp. ANG-S1]|uniref:SDR family NAD(P)-dependent oxidoreductase n=1 Tax=Tateyamaria sp. ANG-S1 TaxID=1577905 RepID=UPI00057D9D8C|nr:SDR family oxidoreductase [Tateyamaria sp. ANG-S1]KIC51099.1 oxidoreductase [Tateyamaria sp. ANG-S1]